MNDDKDEQNTRISKFMALVLRHKPELIGIIMNSEGWVNLDDFIRKLNIYKHFNVNKETVNIIIKNDEKQRYALSSDGSMIRANQGHSVDINLNLKPEMPPFILYHGTVHKYLEKIKKEGLRPMSRQFIHLSLDKKTAENVGKRRGIPVVLTVNARDMYTAGYNFYQSENKIWMTKTIPIEYINFENNKGE